MGSRGAAGRVWTTIGADGRSRPADKAALVFHGSNRRHWPTSRSLEEPHAAAAREERRALDRPAHKGAVGPAWPARKGAVGPAWPAHKGSSPARPARKGAVAPARPARKGAVPRPAREERRAWTPGPTSRLSSPCTVPFSICYLPFAICYLPCPAAPCVTSPSSTAYRVSARRAPTTPVPPSAPAPPPRRQQHASRAVSSRRTASPVPTALPSCAA